MQQLALDLDTALAPPATFISQCNEAAYAMLDAWPRWPHPIVMVRGGAGTGKSHLAKAFAERAGAALVNGASLHSDSAVALARTPVVVDDADCADETALFHMINAVRNVGSTMLLAATTRQVGGLADLSSRLRAVPEVKLDEPDDALLRQVIIDRFQQRQLAIDGSVVSYLMTRIDRTLHDAVRWVDRVDRKGLAEKRGPTRPLAASVLRDEAGFPER
ncbi:MAG: hypothetical protein AAGB11_17045 [Pseudomonadota bacterium]